MESLPNSITGIHSLYVNKCLSVNNLSTSLNHYDSLHALVIERCDVESLPNSITRIHSLKKLQIEDCMNLKRLPQNLSQLADLTLINCGLESIPSGLRSLTSLSVKNCPIKSLDGCGTGLTKLELLTIRDCLALEDLPTDINTLVTLQELSIEGCTSIKFLPNIAALHNLSTLSLKGCSMIDELPANFEELKNLRKLVLAGTNVQTLPSTIVKLPSLKYVLLPGCFRLETLPNDFDLKGIQIYLPLSFGLDTLPAKFSVIRFPFDYQLHLKDQKKPSSWRQTMVNAPPNLKHLPQPRPGICTNLHGEACPQESRQVITHNQNPLNGHLNLALTLQPFTIPEESWQEVFEDQTNSEKTLNLLDAFHISDEQVLAGTPGYLDEGRSSLPLNLDIGRNHMGFAHDGDGPSEYLHGKDKHIMNYSRVMSQRESRDSESVDSTSHGVTSKALSKEASSPLRTEKRTMSRAIDDGHRMKQRRCESMLSSTQDKMYKVWAKHKENEINFKFKPESSFAELKQELAERLPLEGGKLKIKYLDAPENLGKGDPNASIVRDWVLMTCDADLRHCERYSLGMKILLIVQENQDGTTIAIQDKICEDTRLGFIEACSVEAQDGKTGIIVVKAEYKEHLLRFDFLSTSGVAKLKEEVMKRLPLQEDRMMIKYKDDEDNDWVLLACSDDLQHCLRLSMSSKSKTIRLMIVDC